MSEATNPATGERLATYPAHSLVDLDAIIERADQAFGGWRRSAWALRSARFEALAKRLEAERSSLGLLITREMGKPIRESEAEIDKCAAVCRYFAREAEGLLADQPVEAGFRESWVTFQPLGVVLAIMPWNFPLWQVFRAAAPALMAGNAMVVKHASNVPGCALAIERLFQEAEFPPGLCGNLMVSGRDASVAVAHPKVRAVTLTGSTGAGEKVATLAGSQLKKCVLELGGSDPYLVLEDADLALAAKALTIGKLRNAGQSCIAVKRIIVVESVREAFEKLLVAEMGAFQASDPEQPGCQLGPMARADQRDELHQQVERTMAEGATLALGGVIPNQTGCWYPPTVLTGVEPGMTAAREELFGPAVVVLGVTGESEAIELANATEFGLGAGLFTRNMDRARAIARLELAAGSVAINGVVQSDPRLPFGGIKRSGYGRELAAFGLHEFVNIKSILRHEQ